MLKQEDSELLSAYADNELAGPELLRVQEQLASSIEWRKELESLQKMKNLSGALPRIETPLDLIDMIETQVLRAQEKEKSFWNLPSFLGLSNAWTFAGSLATVTIFLVAGGAYRAHQNSFIPLEPLIAAHTHSHVDSLFHQNVVTASQYSSQIKRHVQP